MYSIPRSSLIRLVLLFSVAILQGSRDAAAAPPLPIGEALTASLQRDKLESIDDLRNLQSQIRQVVSMVRPATVAVELDDSIGSGVVISADGLVLTAGHVTVEPNRELWLRFPNNKRVRGRSYGVNHGADSGLLKIEEDPPSDEGWPFVPLAKEPSSLGDWVVGIGQPNGYFEDRAPPVRLGRVLQVRGATLSTDATLVGGDSGGPLVNLRGEVVGIHSRIGERITDNFHVSAAAYHEDWDRLIAGRMLGTPDGEDDADFRPLVGLAVRVVEGRCIVTQVFAESPAEQAGVLVGDVLESFANKPIKGIGALARRAAAQEAYGRAKLQLSRDGKALEVEIWLGRTARQFPGADAPPSRDERLSFWGAQR